MQKIYILTLLTRPDPTTQVYENTDPTRPSPTQPTVGPDPRTTLLPPRQYWTPTGRRNAAAVGVHVYMSGYYCVASRHLVKIALWVSCSEQSFSGKIRMPCLQLQAEGIWVQEPPERWLVSCSDGVRRGQSDSKIVIAQPVTSVATE